MDPDEIPKDGEFYTISATVNKKTFVISCGDGTQRIKWLAHVAIARWDEGENQGWRYLGAPAKVTFNNEELDMGAIIKDILRTGDRIYVTTTLDPSETR